MARKQKRTFKMWVAVGSTPARDVLGYTRESVVSTLARQPFATTLTPVRATLTLDPPRKKVK